MAPNNALSERPKTTTVLPSGTVEARGMGTNHTGSREVVSAEIQSFLKGEGKLSFHTELRAFFTVWTFITRLPGPTWCDHHPGFLMKGMAYFPMAGMLVGIFVSSFYDVCNATFGLPPVIAAAVSMASSFWVTGCFHEDGLGDSADGIGGGWSRQQILRIMTDTRLGTYGCAVLILYTVAKMQLLAALGTSQWSLFEGCAGAGPALVVSHTVARLNSPYLIRTRPYVDEGGPKYKFYTFMLEAKYLVTWLRVIWAGVTSYVVTWILFGHGVASGLILASLFAGECAGVYGNYLLGGVMGDFLGATICVTEIIVLTGILMKDAFYDLIVEVQRLVTSYKEGGCGNVEELSKMFEDPRLVALIRFLLVICLTILWCSAVGHPSVFVRDAAIKNAEKNDGEIRIGIYADECGPEDGELNDSKLEVNDNSFQESYENVRRHIDTLAKPVGSLGTLEDWAARLAVLQKSAHPQMDKVSCIIFAADHGVAADAAAGGENCSSYPQAVTRCILEGLERGVSGASVFASALQVDLKVVDVGVVGKPVGDGTGVVQVSPAKLVNGTRNACTENSMSRDEVELCIQKGREAVTNAVKSGVNMIVLGEIGIGNTTTSSMLLAALTNVDVALLCDGGATVGRAIDQAAIDKKIKIVERALRRHDVWHGTANRLLASLFDLKENATENASATDILGKLGGAEIAALVGSILEASDRGVPVMIDGFIVTVAALLSCRESPYACRILFLATKSAEKGHSISLMEIKRIAKSQNLPYSPPCLDMGLRMGEATGALLAVPIARCACAMLRDMATIQDIIEPNNDSQK